MPIIVLGKREEASAVFAEQRRLLMPANTNDDAAEPNISENNAQTDGDVPDVPQIEANSEIPAIRVCFDVRTKVRHTVLYCLYCLYFSVPQGLTTELEKLLHAPVEVSDCLHQGLSSKTPPWILKLSKLRAICTPQIEAIFSCILEGLHTDGGIPIEHATHVRGFVGQMFISAAQGRTGTKAVQCEPEPCQCSTS